MTNRIRVGRSPPRCHNLAMAFLWAGLWIAGAVPLAIVTELLKSESPRIVRAARIAFALLLGADLLLAAVFFTVGTSPSRLSADQATRSIWWLTVIAGGIPIVLVSGWAVRRVLRTGITRWGSPSCSSRR